MTATNHVLTGAVIAVAVRRPELAIPLAFVSHFVLDSLPHFGFEEEDVLVRNKSKLFRTVVPIDAAAMILLIALLPYWASRAGLVVQPAVVAWSMVAAFSPDLIWIVRFFRERRAGERGTAGWFARFHKKIQWSETLRGLHIEYVWAAGMFLLLGIMA